MPQPCSSTAGRYGIRRAAGLLVGAMLATVLLSAMPVTVVAPRFTHPGAGQTFYFVLTDRFANGSRENDTGGLPGGPDVHGFDPGRITHYHGGDFSGLTERLDYLKRLGVTAIWVTPPFRNQTLRQKPGIGPMAAHHGYWILDFMRVDPHLGTDEEFREFVRQAHARDLRVYLDIVVNHTADVIRYHEGTDYRDRAATPYRDASGRPFDLAARAYNGLGAPEAFPPLSPEHSFPHRPVVPAGLENVKHPDWLNDVTLYHNRGNRHRLSPESTIDGDFGGLDDLLTEHPRVVQGFIGIFTHWIENYGVDGFRVDTARHVNHEFWQAFLPAIQARARELGRPDFLVFGEVANDDGGPELLSEFSTGVVPFDATLDFGFFVAARKFISRCGTAAELADFFSRDDYYTDHDSNVHSTTTFLGNHDAGRFAYFLQRDNPDAPPEQLADLVKLGHALLFLVRGQPVVYYGDEQGMIGRGGDHERAREDMFPAQAPDFRGARLLATTRTGADDKFDVTHPFYRLISELGRLRAGHPALRTGGMLLRPSGCPGLFAFSRIERDERIEYLVVLNNSRDAVLSAQVATSQPAGASLELLFESKLQAAGQRTLVAGAGGVASVSLAPLQFAVWRAVSALPVPARAPQIILESPPAGAILVIGTREVDGLVFPGRHEIRAHVRGGDGFAEVTFAMSRASRPGQFELLGTDDTEPYRVFWRPPPDLAPGEVLTFHATVSDLRGGRSSTQVDGIRIQADEKTFGPRGAFVPKIKLAPPPLVQLAAGHEHALSVQAVGTGPLQYQWLCNDAVIPGATGSDLVVAEPGRYTVLVRNRAGTVISRATEVTRIP